MTDAPPDPAAFYASRLGQEAAALLRERIARLWPSAAGLAVLGLGYPVPFLPGPGARPERSVAALLRPAAHAGPAGCVVAEGGLPFADGAFDRALLVHAVEQAADPGHLLREVWRVLREGGRLIVVAPNRLGAWAHVEATPFGHGKPFSRAEIDRLLVGHAFRVHHRDAALYWPPLAGRAVPHGGRACDAAGRAALPLLGGVTLTEAVKEVAGVHPLLVAPSRARLGRRVLAEAG